RLARVAEGVDARRDAAIDGNLEQDLLDLVLGDAVLQGALDVQLQFLRTAERAEHRQVDDAAGAAVQARPGPQRAPAEFGRPFGHRPGEFVRARNGLVDVVFTQHFLADLQSLVEQLSHRWFLSLVEYGFSRQPGSAMRSHQARHISKRIETPDVVDDAIYIPIA